VLLLFVTAILLLLVLATVLAELSLLRPVAAIPTPGFVNALALHATR
jgi:hypothetical protein